MSVICFKIDRSARDCIDTVLSRQVAMIECKELTGKVIQLCTIFEESGDGPDLQIDFTDGTCFTVSLRANVSMEARCLRSAGGEPQLLHDYTARSPR